MPQQLRRRRQASITLNAFGTKFVQQLGRGMVLRELALRLSGTVTLPAAANNARATLARGDEWALITRIDLIANGTDVIRSMTGTQLRMLNRLIYGVGPRPAAQIGDATTAVPTFDSTLILPLWQFLSIKPMDTALDTSKLSDLRLEITTETALGWQSAAAATALAATLDVVSLESFGVDAAFSDCKIYPLQATSSAANQNFQIQLPVSPLYRGFFINAAAGASQISADSPTAISNVQLVSGTTIFADIPWQVLRDWQRQRISQQREFTQAVAAVGRLNDVAPVFLNNAKSTLLDEDAWAFMDLIPDGYLSEGVDSYGYAELFLNINLAAAATVTVLPVQIFPLRGASKAA